MHCNPRGDGPWLLLLLSEAWLISSLSRERGLGAQWEPDKAAEQEQRQREQVRQLGFMDLHAHWSPRRPATLGASGHLTVTSFQRAPSWDGSTGGHSPGAQENSHCGQPAPNDTGEKKEERLNSSGRGSECHIRRKPRASRVAGTSSEACTVLG